MILTDEERTKFAEYLEQDAAGDDLLSKQMELLGDRVIGQLLTARKMDAG